MLHGLPMSNKLIKKNKSIYFIYPGNINTKTGGYIYEKNILDGAKKTLESGIIKLIETEIILDEVYNKYLTFSDIEKNLINNNFRLIALEDISCKLPIGVPTRYKIPFSGSSCL